ncbi:MAG: GAF domain-containing protein [Chloroflexi bacterium]|nr:GAF domain-containing protein [Chloroflexota bacterium]
MTQRLRRIIRVRYPYVTEASQERARIVMLMTAIVSLAGIGGIAGRIINAALGGEMGLEVVLMAAGVVGVMGALRWLVQAGYERSAAYAFVSVLTAAYLLAFLLRPTSDNLTLAGFMLPIIAAALVIGRRAMFTVALIMTATLVIAFMTQLSTGSFVERDSARETTSSLLVAYLASLPILLALTTQFITDFRRLRRKAGNLEHMLQVTRSLSRELRESETFQTDDLDVMIDMLQAEFNVYYVQVYLRDDPTAPLTLRAASGMPGERLIEEEQTLDATAYTTSALALRQHKSVLTTLDSPPAQREGFLLATRAELAVPLVLKDHVLGLLVLHSEDEAAFTDERITILEALGDELVIAIQRWQLRRDLDIQHDHLVASRSLLEQREREVRRLTAAVEGRVWDEYLRYTGRPTGFKWHGGDVSAWADGPRPSVTEPRLETLEGQRQRLAVPVVLGGRVLGELLFETKQDGQWTEAMLEMATAVANRLALALDNARLFDEAQTTAAQAQRVTAIAADLQRAHDVDVLLKQAAAQFNQALGSDFTHIRLGILPSETED